MSGYYPLTGYLDCSQCPSCRSYLNVQLVHLKLNDGGSSGYIVVLEADYDRTTRAVGDPAGPTIPLPLHAAILNKTAPFPMGTPAKTNIWHKHRFEHGSPLALLEKDDPRYGAQLVGAHHISTSDVKEYNDNASFQTLVQKMQKDMAFQQLSYAQQLDQRIAIAERGSNKRKRSNTPVDSK